MAFDQFFKLQLNKLVQPIGSEEIIDISYLGDYLLWNWQRTTVTKLLFDNASGMISLKLFIGAAK